MNEMRSMACYGSFALSMARINKFKEGVTRWMLGLGLNTR